MNIKTLSSKEFATKTALKPNLLAWFLGAGASAASGIPTAQDMIRDFKAKIYCQDTNVSRKEIDISDPIWMDRIDAHCADRNSITLKRDSEYAAYFETVYPEEKQRRQYIERAIEGKLPCFGHKVLGSLMALGKIDCVFTTNFDPLIEQSVHEANLYLDPEKRKLPTVAAIESNALAYLCLDESNWPLIVKLHGDYKSIKIKNTDSELKEQNTILRNVLIKIGERYGMIFVGYSGRDESIMQTLETILDKERPFPNGLYWVASSTSCVLPQVSKFLSLSQKKGVDVNVIECSTFDELAADIIKSIELSQSVYDWVMQGRPKARLELVELPNKRAGNYPVIRYSSLRVERMPTEARCVKIAKYASSLDIRNLLREKKINAIVAAIGKDVAVFGNDDEIVEVLKPLEATISGIVKLDPIADSWAKGLIYDALVTSLVSGLPLTPRFRGKGHSIVVPFKKKGQSLVDLQSLVGLNDAYGVPLTGVVPETDLKFQEGIYLKLERLDKRWWLGFEPYTFVQNKQTQSEKATERRRKWLRDRWATRYNKTWANIIDAWAKLLTDCTTKKAFGIEENRGIDALFEVSKLTGWSYPGKKSELI